MIPKFSDHAANERTYLAWLRTGIAIIAFGFLIERFDLFLNVVSRQLENHDVAARLQHSGSGVILGLGLVFIGLVVMCVATARFLNLRRKIASEDPEAFGPKADVSLGVLLGLMGVFVFVYLLHLVIG